MKKFYLDTNIIVRLIANNNTTQHHQAKKIFKEIETGKKNVYLSLLVINEVLWILSRYYKIKRTVFVPSLIKLFSLKNIKTWEVKKSSLFFILEGYQKSSFDFTDLYLSYKAGKLAKIVSFDKDFDKLKATRAESL
jgi:predicted nucleic acid-binding protein